jgi:hypothetical protein
MAIYPSSAASDSNLYVAVNGLATALSSSVDNVVTSIPVTSTTGFPAVGYIVIDSEVIKYTSIDSTHFLGCTRGADGTSASSHTTSAPVKAAAVADHHNALKEEIKAIETDLTNLQASITPVTATNTATSALNRIAMLCNQIKQGLGLTNWYDTAPTLFGTNFRNRLINGNMRIDQRSAGGTFTINNSGFTYTLDRWSCYGAAADGVFTVNRLGVSNGMPNYMRIITTTADASIGAAQIYVLQQAVEGYNVADFRFGLATAQTVSLSFWVRSSLTGTFSGAIKNSATTRAYPFTFVINSAATWEYKTIVIPGDTTGTWLIDNGVGLRIYFDLGCGSSNRSTVGTWQAGDFMGVTGSVNLIGTLNASLDLGNVQLEIGQPTEFEFRPIQTELAMCQRYFEKTFDLETAIGTATDLGGVYTRMVANHVQPIQFRAFKRSQPTVTTYNPSTGGSGTWRDISASTNLTATAASIGSGGCYIAITSAVSGNGINGHWIASSEL